MNKVHIYREDNADHEICNGFISSFKISTKYNKLLDIRDGVLRGTGGNHIVNKLGETSYSIPKSLKSGNIVILIADRDNSGDKKIEGFTKSLKNADGKSQLSDEQLHNFYVIGCDVEPETMKKSVPEFKGKSWNDIGKILANDWFDKKELWKKYCSHSIPVLGEICDLLQCMLQV